MQLKEQIVLRLSRANKHNSVVQTINFYLLITATGRTRCYMQWKCKNKGIVKMTMFYHYSINTNANANKICLFAKFQILNLFCFFHLQFLNMSTGNTKDSPANVNCKLCLPLCI